MYTHGPHRVSPRKSTAGVSSRRKTVTNTGCTASPGHLKFRPPIFPCVPCEGCDIVQSDHAPQAGVAQGIFDGELVRRRVGHQVELEEEQDEEVERRVRRDA